MAVWLGRIGKRSLKEAKNFFKSARKDQCNADWCHGIIMSKRSSDALKCGRLRRPCIFRCAEATVQVRPWIAADHVEGTRYRRHKPLPGFPTVAAPRKFW